MSLQRSDENPNDVTGGAGCLCHPRGSDETRGPYILFPATTTDDPLSPHAVLCDHCAYEAAEGLDLYEEVTDAEVVEDEPNYPAMPEPTRVLKI